MPLFWLPIRIWSFWLPNRTWSKLTEVPADYSFDPDPYRGENPSIWLKKLSPFNLFLLLFFQPPGPVRVAKWPESLSFILVLPAEGRSIMYSFHSTLHCLAESSSSQTGSPGSKTLKIHALKVSLPRNSSTFTHAFWPKWYLYIFSI